jgi:Icc protein
MEAQGKGSADDSGRKDLVMSSECGVRSKAVLTVLLLLLVAVSPLFAAQDQQINKKLAALEKLPGKFSFIVIGDNRSGDDIYKKIISLAMERKPDFIVNVGDMITKPGNREQWANFWTLSKSITIPYFLTVGNHDVNPKARSSESIYREQVDLPGNELYYSFVAGNSLFVVLDTSLGTYDRRIQGEQLTWLEDLLLNSHQAHKFVFLHHPLYTEPGKWYHSGDCLDIHPRERDNLEALFVKAKIDAVFAGHEHVYQRKQVDGILHITSGGGGAPIYAKDIDGGFSHFVQVIVDGDSVRAEVVDVQGKVRDRFSRGVRNLPL